MGNKASYWIMKCSLLIAILTTAYNVGYTQDIPTNVEDVILPFYNPDDHYDIGTIWMKFDLEKGLPYRVQWTNLYSRYNDDMVMFLFGPINNIDSVLTNDPEFFVDAKALMKSYDSGYYNEELSYVPRKSGSYYLKIQLDKGIWRSSISINERAQLTKLYHDTVLPSYVNLMYQVTSANSVYGVPNLVLEDFVIKEDGSELSPTESNLRIGSLEQVPYTLKTVLMLDNSASVGANILDIRAAALEIVNNLTVQQEVAVYSFSENPNLIIDFTSDKDSLRDAVNSIFLGAPTTNLYGSTIVGLSRWNDSYSIDKIVQGFLVLLTDGSDTQARATLGDVLEERGSKNIYTLGLGSEIDPDVLESIGNAGYFPAENVTELASIFDEIQYRLTSWANSLYWLNYISPKRGDINHELSIKVNYESNTLTQSFNSKDFSSVYPGVTINSSFTDPGGIDTLIFELNEEVELVAETLFPVFTPMYEWTSGDTNIIQIAEGDSANNSTVIAKQVGKIGETTTITLRDTQNNYSKVLNATLLVSNEIHEDLPTSIKLYQNYPNPFNPITTISFDLPISSEVKLIVRDILGREVAVLVNEIRSSGNHQISFDATRLSSGVYFYSLTTPEFTSTRKLLLTK